MPAVADYLNPDLPAGLARVPMPVIDATPATLDGYGFLVDDPAKCAIEIVRWHANYHPDGGQLFFPLDRKPFLVPLALPGDDVAPAKFVCFRFDGSRGLYIHPNIWHEGVFATRGTQRFFDQQGAVHARVSVDFAREFGCLLEAPIE